MSAPRFDARRTKPQHLTNYMGAPIVVTFSGTCIGCGSRVFDGGSDPRGVVPSKHYNSEVTVTHDGKNVSFPACDDCMNDEPRYNHAVRRAEKRAARLATRKAAAAQSVDGTVPDGGTMWSGKQV